MVRPPRVINESTPDALAYDHTTTTLFMSLDGAVLACPLVGRGRWLRDMCDPLRPPAEHHTPVSRSRDSASAQSSATQHHADPTEEEHKTERAEKIAERKAAKAALQAARDRQNKAKAKDRKADRGAKRDY